MEPALARLRDPEGAALRALARLVVLETTRTPIGEIAPPQWLASQLKTVIEALSTGDLVRSFVERRIEGGREHIDGEERPVRTWWPEEVDAPTRRVLRQGWTPSEAMTFRILDQPAMRALVAEVLTSVLGRFRKRLQRVEGTFLGGLGGRAARRGKGLFGGIGGLASNVVGVVRDELESGLDEIVRDFVQNATKDVLQSIACYLANPAHAEAFAELRVGVLDVLLDTSVADLAEEFNKVHPLELVEVVVAGLHAAADRPDFVERTTERIQAVLDEMGQGTLGDWLQEVELADVWTETTTDLVAQRLVAVVATDDFAAWWIDLHRP